MRVLVLPAGDAARLEDGDVDALLARLVGPRRECHAVVDVFVGEARAAVALAWRESPAPGDALNPHLPGVRGPAVAYAWWSPDWNRDDDTDDDQDPTVHRLDLGDLVDDFGDLERLVGLTAATWTSSGRDYLLAEGYDQLRAAAEARVTSFLRRR